MDYKSEPEYRHDLAVEDLSTSRKPVDKLSTDGRCELQPGGVAVRDGQATTSRCQGDTS